MDAKQQRIRISQLDRQLGSLSDLVPIEPPYGGWIKSIREALGMSLRTFGKRLGVAPSTAHQLEGAEANGTITLNRLRAAANVLECDVALVLIPRKPLREILDQQALAVAREQLLRTGHSMNLENQGVVGSQLDSVVRETATELLIRGDSLWE